MKTRHGARQITDSQKRVIQVLRTLTSNRTIKWEVVNPTLAKLTSQDWEYELKFIKETQLGEAHASLKGVNSSSAEMFEIVGDESNGFEADLGDLFEQIHTFDQQDKEQPIIAALNSSFNSLSSLLVELESGSDQSALEGSRSILWPGG